MAIDCQPSTRCRSAQFYFSLLLISACTLLSGCSSLTDINGYPSKQHDGNLPSLGSATQQIQSIAIESERTIISLTEQQQQDFLAYMAQPELQSIPIHKRLYNYLDNKVAGFDYRGDTYSAMVALEKNAGNCLSLALLTTALAKLAGVEIGYQRVDTTPVYKKQEDILLLSYHVRAFLYDPDFHESSNVMVFRRPRLVVDYFPDRGDIGTYEVSEQAFLSMYYRNIASDLLLNKQFDKALAYANHALLLAPGDPENVNLAAVILKRMGLTEEAHDWYQYGLKHTSNNINLLSNYQILLEQEGQAAAANDIAQRLLTLDDPNPYAWIKEGHEAYQKARFNVAIRYYQIAIDKAPYLDDAYFGLAKSHFARREYRQAAQAMKMAAEKAFEESDRELYYAKLSTLRSQSQGMPHRNRD